MKTRIRNSLLQGNEIENNQFLDEKTRITSSSLVRQRTKGTVANRKRYFLNEEKTCIYYNVEI